MTSGRSLFNASVGRPAQGLSRLLGGGTSHPGGARAGGGSHGRPVELDVAAAAVAVVQLVRGKQEIQIRRVDENICPLLGQLDVELVGDTRLAGVRGAYGEIDVVVWRCQVRPCLAADDTGAGQPVFGVEAVLAVLEVVRNARPVDVQADVVVHVLQVPPGRCAVLAATAGDAEIRMGTVKDDESAAGQEVAVS